MSKIEKPKGERAKTVRTARTPRAKAALEKVGGSNGATLATVAAISEFDIACRAFELYCQRGGGHGHDVDDWLRAETELAASR